MLDGDIDDKAYNRNILKMCTFLQIGNTHYVPFIEIFCLFLFCGAMYVTAVGSN